MGDIKKVLVLLNFRYGARFNLSGESINSDGITTTVYTVRDSYTAPSKTETYDQIIVIGERETDKWELGVRQMLRSGGTMEFHYDDE